jgi:O-antigen biosynthesis protein WbqP
MKNFIKYSFDWLVALIMFLFFFPTLIVPVSIILKLTSPGPIIFKQLRVGQNKKNFYLYKFRTMHKDAPAEIPKDLLDNPNHWITPFGKFLRRTSIDEIPQLINILKGEMSFIGPRPALYNQIILIQERDKYKINSLRPGLSGIAQVNGRDSISIETKVNFDRLYLSKQSFFFDLYIMIISIKKIFKDKDLIEGKKDNS